MILISNEVSVWQFWDNLRYFDKETLEEIQHIPKDQGAYQWSMVYPNERAVVQGMRMVRDWLAAYDGDVVKARQAIRQYSALDMLMDIVEGKPMPEFMAGDEPVFDFFLKIWQRRNMSRALVVWYDFNFYALEIIYKLVMSGNPYIDRMRNEMLAFKQFRIRHA